MVSSDGMEVCVCSDPDKALKSSLGTIESSLGELSEASDFSLIFVCACAVAGLERLTFLHSIVLRVALWIPVGASVHLVGNPSDPKDSRQKGRAAHFGVPAAGNLWSPLVNSEVPVSQTG